MEKYEKETIRSVVKKAILKGEGTHNINDIEKTIDLTIHLIEETLKGGKK